MDNQSSVASLESVAASLRPEVPSKVLLNGTGTWWSTMAECQREMAQFVSDRLAKDGEAIKETLKCRIWADALAVQTKWFDETVRDYNAEVRKLTDLYTKSASSALQTDHQSV